MALVHSFGFLALFCILFPAFAGGLAFFLDRKGLCRARDVLCCAAPISVLLGCLPLSFHMGETFSLFTFFGMGIGFELIGLSWCFCLIASFLWVMSHLFAVYYLESDQSSGRYALFSFLTFGAILGVFLSADFYTALFFFEIMSFTSWVLVIHERSAEALDAAKSYLGFAVIGGLATLFGLFLLFSLCGTVRFDELPAACAGIADKRQLYLAAGFVLTGFAAKAGMWPLHTWLPAAHPVAPAPASALLSGIITKAGVFGIFVISSRIFLYDAAWGVVLLLFGVVTMVTGAVLAVFSVNLKRTLACSSMSQIGFILLGVGMQGILGSHNALAVWGSVLHAFQHSLIKLCLFSCAGVIAHSLHQLGLNEIRGFGKTSRTLCFSFLMGALGITGVPGWNGYISKTLLHESIVEGIGLYASSPDISAFLTIVEWVFLFSGGLTVAYLLKLFVCIFVEKPSSLVRAYGKHTRLSFLPSFVLIVSGGVLPILGCLPHQTLEKAALLSQSFFFCGGIEHAIRYASPENLRGAAISLLIGCLIYFGLVRPLGIRDGEYRDLWPAWLDLEKKLYRPALTGCAKLLALLVSAVNTALNWCLQTLLPFLGAFFARLFSSIPVWGIAFLRGLLYWGAAETIVLKEDETFAVYEKDITGTRGFRGTLAFGLFLFGMAMIFMFAYVLFF